MNQGLTLLPPVDRWFLDWLEENRARFGASSRITRYGMEGVYVVFEG